jgi:hypothetical protein
MLQVKVLNPKAKRILDDLASLKLISIKEESTFTLTPLQKKSIEVSRKQIKAGKFRNNKSVISDLKKWVKEQ